MAAKAAPKSHQTNLRLDDESVRLLRALIEHMGIDRSDVLRLAIRVLAKRERVK